MISWLDIKSRRLGLGPEVSTRFLAVNADISTVRPEEALLSAVSKGY